MSSTAALVAAVACGGASPALPAGTDTHDGGADGSPQLTLVGLGESRVVLHDMLARPPVHRPGGTVPDPCLGFRVTDAPDSLIPALCDIGFTIGELPTLLRRTAEEASEDGPLDNAEMAGLVSSVIGADATGAFRDAGLL